MKTKTNTPKTFLSVLMVLLFSSSMLFAQDLKPIALQVQKEKNNGITFTQVDGILEKTVNRQLTFVLEKEVDNAQTLSYNKNIGGQILANRYRTLKFDMMVNGSMRTIELVAVNESFNDYTVNSASGQTRTTGLNDAMHYRGVVLGLENSSLAVFSIFKEELIGVISIQNEGDFAIGKAKGYDSHLIYNDNNLKNGFAFECFSDDIDQKQEQGPSNGSVTRASDDYCIEIYFEVDYEIYQDNGNSVLNTENFVIGLFNQVSSIYQNESVNVAISEIFVWDTPDSYSNTSTSTARTQFVSANPTFNGDLAHLLEYRPSSAGGIAYGIGGICGGTSSPGPYAVTSLEPSYAVVPTYSRQVKVVTHEIGHNFGSRHTHACVWNGNNTSIDDYGNYTNPGPVFQAGSEGAACVDQANPKLSVTPTIMSYYDSRSFGTFPMSNGFGTQPGNQIRATIDAATCLTQCATSCLTTITSYPYTESFETSFGDWTQETTDDFDWTRLSGATSSNATGPTSAFDGSFYAYTESSSPNYPSKSAILIGPCFDLTGQANPTLTFAYHMYGSTMGTLKLQVSTDGGATWTSIWGFAGDQGNSWLSASVDLSAYAGSVIQLRYAGQTSTSFRSDMAIDDIAISNSTCNTTITAFPYTESFESSLGDWTQETSDDFDWTRLSGSTPSIGTGPTSAFDGSFYAYTESSSPNYPSKSAILIGPCFDLSGQANPTMTFAYHMWGSAMGTLKLQVSDDGGATWNSIWGEAGDQGNGWLQATVDLSAYAGSVIQLRYYGQTATSYTSDMAIDDISISNSNCNTTITAFPYAESFETDFGGWEQETSDDFDWTRLSGSTPSFGTGPSAAAHGSYYVYTESSSPNYPSKVAILKSPCFDLTGQSFLGMNFAYHMWGSAMGGIKLQVSTDGGSTWTSIWGASGDQGNAWLSGYANLTPYTGNVVQLRFIGQTSTSYTSDMAIDRISINITGLVEAPGKGQEVNSASSEGPDVSIYPNPATDYAIVSYITKDSEEINISVVDMLGKQIFSKQASVEDGGREINIPTGSFAPGSYMVIITSNSGESFKRKLIVNR